MVLSLIMPVRYFCYHFFSLPFLEDLISISCTFQPSVHLTVQLFLKEGHFKNICFPHQINDQPNYSSYQIFTASIETSEK